MRDNLSHKLFEIMRGFSKLLIMLALFVGLNIAFICQLQRVVAGANPTKKEMFYASVTAAVL
jgi:hypothetical protein